MRQGSNGPKVNGYHNEGRIALMETRRNEAESRNIERARRTADEQLHLLEMRPGNSLRERARLLGRSER